MTDLTTLDIRQASEQLGSRDITSAALTDAYLDRVARLDGDINAYVTVTADLARRQAAEADARAARGERLGPLDGVPLALKDNIDVAGVPTSNGLGPRQVPDPAADAPVVERLKAAGAVILGKVNMHEGAFGGVTDNPHHGLTHNPWKHGHTPGGSSGGTGAAVAAHLCVAGLGTDTMASVRLPAAYCGIVGLKPTYGLVSTRGVVPLSWRLDHVGPIARTVADVGLLLNAMAGFDPDCAESVAAPEVVDYAVTSSADLKGVRIGVIENFAAVETEPAVAAGFRRGLDILESLGSEIQNLTLPGYDPTLARRAGLLVIEAEAWVSYEQDIERFPDAFTGPLKTMLEYGRDVSGARLIKAERDIAAVAHGVDWAFNQVDFIVSPTAPQVAFLFGGDSPVTQSEFMAPANFSGCPAISLPVDLTPEGLPIGFQIMAPRHAEPRLIAAALAFEQAAKFDAQPPMA